MVLDAAQETRTTARALGASEETINTLSTKELSDWIRDRRNHYFIDAYADSSLAICYRDSTELVKMKVVIMSLFH